MKMIKKAVSKVNKGVAVKVSVLSTAMMMAAGSAFAADPGSVNLVKGSMDLIKDAMTWILALIPISAITALGYHGWMKSLADGEPSAVQDRNKKMKNVAIGSAFGVCAAGLIKVLLNYYNPTVAGTITGALDLTTSFIG